MAGGVHGDGTLRCRGYTNTCCFPAQMHHLIITNGRQTMERQLKEVSYLDLIKMKEDREHALWEVIIELYERGKKQ
jgi:hypothetical protein